MFSISWKASFFPFKLQVRPSSLLILSTGVKKDFGITKYTIKQELANSVYLEMGRRRKKKKTTAVKLISFFLIFKQIAMLKVTDFFAIC